MNIENEQAKYCIFISLLRTRNEGKSASTVIDGKVAKPTCYTKPTLTSAMTVYQTTGFLSAINRPILSADKKSAVTNARTDNIADSSHLYVRS